MIRRNLPLGNKNRSDKQQRGTDQASAPQVRATSASGVLNFSVIQPDSTPVRGLPKQKQLLSCYSCWVKVKKQGRQASNSRNCYLIVMSLSYQGQLIHSFHALLPAECLPTTSELCCSNWSPIRNFPGASQCPHLAFFSSQQFTYAWFLND